MLVKNLHTVSAVIELGAGLALLAVPSIAVRLLLGSEISRAVVPLGRIAGAALLALGVACWLASGETKSCAARGLVVAMLVYNFGAVIVLGAAGIQLPTVGVALWPAVILHAVMAVWCVRVLIGPSKNVPH
jgi:xanthine/uracil permease